MIISTIFDKIDDVIFGSLVFFSYLCSMKKDEMIALLQQQISFLQQQLREANRKADALLKEVASLRNLLERKSEEEAKQKRVIKGLAKISQNKSEKQPSAPASQEAVPGQPSEKKERAHTNNGAKRKQHLEVEVVEENVDPEDPRFNKDLARLYKTRDVIRYELIPMRFIKKVYHVRTYTQNDEYFSGKAPDAPFLNSQYDGSFIAGMAQLRYMYAMSVERIVKLFNDNGFDMDKYVSYFTASDFIVADAGKFQNSVLDFTPGMAVPQSVIDDIDAQGGITVSGIQAAGEGELGVTYARPIYMTNGFSVDFSLDQYKINGVNGVDSWISLQLSDKMQVTDANNSTPIYHKMDAGNGDPAYGSGLVMLLRPLENNVLGIGEIFWNGVKFTPEGAVREKNWQGDADGCYAFIKLDSFAHIKLAITPNGSGGFSDRVL